MKLGELTQILHDHDWTAEVRYDNGTYPQAFDSWRGRYEQLTLIPGDEPQTVGHLLELATAANGATFTGYKGGDFVMNENTPVWADPYGEYWCNGIVSHLIVDGDLVLVRAELSDYA